jgi:hypothetical protein
VTARVEPRRAAVHHAGIARRGDSVRAAQAKLARCRFAPVRA